MKVWKIHSQLVITDPDMVHNNYGVEFLSDDPELVKKCYQFGYELFVGDWDIKEKLKTFIQGHNEEWIYWEFWGVHDIESENVLLEQVLKLGEMMHMEVGHNIKTPW